MHFLQHIQVHKCMNNDIIMNIKPQKRMSLMMTIKKQGIWHVMLVSLNVLIYDY